MIGSTYIIPPLYSGDELTPAGEELAGYLKRRTSALKDDPEIWDSSPMDKERAYYAAVLVDPPIKTPAQWIKAHHDAAVSLWGQFLQTLDPVDRARAEQGYPPGTTPPAPAAESYTPMTARHTVLLSESDQTPDGSAARISFADAIRRLARTPDDMALIRQAAATGELLYVTDGKLSLQRHQRRPLTRADLRTPETVKVWVNGS